MVRGGKEKKPKGDESFTKRKQKVGRKKLAPATSTRAEVTAKGLRVGVAKSIVDAQNKKDELDQQQQQDADARFSEVKTNKRNKKEDDEDQVPLVAPDIASIIVSITHYRAGSRAHAMKSAQGWVRHDGGRTARASPAVAVQLLQGALAALTDTDAQTRQGAAAVVLAVDRHVLGPDQVWPAVAEMVADRLSIALTHASFGARSTATQLLADMCGGTVPIEGDQQGSSSGGSKGKATEQPPHAPEFITFLARSGNFDAALESIIRNVVLVVKTKAVQFPVLPPIFKAVLAACDNGGSGGNFVQRHASLFHECLHDVWEFGSVRVKESLELTVNLLRNEPAMQLVISILHSTAQLLLLTSLFASPSSSFSSSTTADVMQPLLPTKLLVGSICHMTSDRVPFSVEELCSARTTSPRKAALAVALGEVYVALLQVKTPGIGESLRPIKKLLAQTIALGFDLAQQQQQQQQTELPLLATFSFRAATCPSLDTGAVFSPRLLDSLAKWFDVVLGILRQCQHQQQQTLPIHVRASIGKLFSVLRVTITNPAVFSSNNISNADKVSEHVAQCWSKIVQFTFMLKSTGEWQVARQAVELLYELLSTGGRTYFLEKNSANSNSGSGSPKREKWLQMLTSVSSVVALPSGEDSWALGTVLSAPHDLQTARFIITPEVRSLCFGCLHYASLCMSSLSAELPASWRKMQESASLREVINKELPSASQYVRLLDLAL